MSAHKESKIVRRIVRLFRRIILPWVDIWVSVEVVNVVVEGGQLILTGFSFESKQ